jgi:hypothetical protein
MYWNHVIVRLLIASVFCVRVSSSDLLAQTNDFEMKSEVICAYSDGPVVLKVTLRNLTKTTFAIYSHDPNPDWPSMPACSPRVNVESGTNPVYFLHDLSLRSGTVRRTLPGHSEIVRYSYLHHRGYNPSLEGKVTINVSWDFRFGLESDDPKKSTDGKPIELTAKHAVEIKPLTKETRPELVKLIRENANLTTNDGNDRHGFALLIRMSDPDFPPLEFELLHKPLHSSNELYRLLRQARSRLPRPMFNKALIDYLRSPNPYGFCEAIDLLHVYPDILPVEEIIRSFRDAPNLLVRLRLFLAYPSFVSCEDRTNFFAEIAKYKPPIDPEILQDQIAKLEDSRFAQRELAMRSLVAHGEPAIPALRQFLSKAPTPDSKRLIQQAIDTIKKLPPPPMESAMLNFLLRSMFDPSCDSPLFQMILSTMAQNDPERWMTMRSRKILEEFAAHQARSKK